MASGKRAGGGEGTPGKRIRLQLHPLNTNTKITSQIPRKDTLAPPLNDSWAKPSTSATNNRGDNWDEDSDIEFLMFASQACDDIERKNATVGSSIAKNNEKNSSFDIKKSVKTSCVENAWPPLQSQVVELDQSNATKDGEISILRTQLKTCQAQLSIAKMEKIKSLEKAQMDFSDEIKRNKDELSNITSQMEFKILEIVKLKEKCRLLESSKMKFIEPPVSSSIDSSKWFGQSQRLNSSVLKTGQPSKQIVMTKENSAQSKTCNKIKLCPLSRLQYPLKNSIAKCIFKKSDVENPIIFNSRENSQFTGNLSYLSVRETIFGNLTEFKIPEKNLESNEEDIKIDYIYKDLSELMNTSDDELHSEDSIKRAFKIALVSKEFLLKTFSQIKQLSKKFSVKTLKEMDEKYMETTKIGADLFMDRKHFDETVWFKEEQAIETRRIMGLLAILCKHIKPLANYVLGVKNIEVDSSFIENCQKDLKFIMKHNEDEQNPLGNHLDIILDICKIVVKINCSHLYTGLFSSICHVLVSCVENSTDLNSINTKLYNIIKEILMLRPHIIVIKYITTVLSRIENNDFLELLCNKSNELNIKPDYGEGIATYNDDTCVLQLLSNTIEVWSIHFISDKNMETMFFVTHNLIKLVEQCNAGNLTWRKCDVHYKCNCSIRLNRCMCYCLYRCASLYNDHYDYLQDVDLLKKCSTTLKFGIMVLRFCNIRDIDFLSHLNDYENHCQMFVHICDTLGAELKLEDIHKEALAEIKEILLPMFDDTEDPAANIIWEESFEYFSIVD